MTNNPTDPKTKSIRVFFAVFPNQATRILLADQVKQLKPLCGGRKVQRQQIHLTLLFLGNVATERIALLQQSAKNVSTQKFELHLNEIRYWKHSQIVYIQSKQFPAELFFLVNSLTHTLSEAGFTFDKLTYKPHITLIRKAIRPVIINLNDSIVWHVDKWFLVQSQQTSNGIQYFPLDRWQLS